VNPTYAAYQNSLNDRLSSYGMPSWIWWLIVGYIFQLCFNKIVWYTPSTEFRDGSYVGNRWLRFRFWFSIYEYLLILPNVAIGQIIILIRMLISFLLWIYYTFSIDLCIMPSGRGTDIWDPGYSSYVSMARTDHRYSNPIGMTFLGVIQQQLTDTRLECGRLKLRKQLQKNIEKRKGGGKDDDEEMGVGGPKGGGPGGGGDEKGDSLLDGESPQTFEYIEALKTNRRVTRKWQLALFLYRNPSLAVYRKGASALRGVAEDDISAAEAWKKTYMPGYTWSSEQYESGKKRMNDIEAVQKMNAQAKASWDQLSEASQQMILKAQENAKKVQSQVEGYVKDADGNWILEGDAKDGKIPWSKLKLPTEEDLPDSLKPLYDATKPYQEMAREQIPAWEDFAPEEVMGYQVPTPEQALAQAQQQLNATGLVPTSGAGASAQASAPSAEAAAPAGESPAGGSGA